MNRTTSIYGAIIFKFTPGLGLEWVHTMWRVRRRTYSRQRQGYGDPLQNWPGSAV
jgi:hypothetical protein